MARLGWSLTQKHNVWYVMHRYHPAKKQVIKTTGETDKEKALVKAIQIVNDARVALSVEGLRGMLKREFTRDAKVKADTQSAKEEEILLGNKLDEVNPRLDTLWTFNDAHSMHDTGVLCDFYRSHPSQHIFVSKRAALKAFFIFLSGKGVKRVKEVTTQHIADYHESVKGVYKPNTMIFNDSSIRNMYNFLDDKYGISIEYPELKIEVPPSEKHITGDDVLTDDEINTISEYLINHVNPIHYRLFMLCLHVGLRKSEALNLLWANVSFTTNKITITTNDADPENGVTASTLKTRRSHRIVPIKKVLKPLLVEWHANRDESNPYVLVTNGNRMLYNNCKLNKKLQNIIAKWHLHLCRHTFISKALSTKDISIAEVALWTGDSVQMILNTYSHFIDTGNIDKF